MQPPSSSSGKTETVQLAAGEQATVAADDFVVFTLGIGSVELDGTLIQPETSYRLRLNRFKRATFYSLTGGTVVVRCESTFSVAKHPSVAPSLTAVVRSSAVQRKHSRVLVLGDVGTGKSTAVRILLNGTLRAHVGDTDCRVVYVEGDTTQGNVCAAGVMAAAEASPPSIPIEGSFLETVPVTFFTGYVQPSQAEAGHVLHCFAQTVSCAEWMLERGAHTAQHLVVDPPPLPEGSDARWFTKQVLDLVRPSHVVVLGDFGDGWLDNELTRTGLETVVSRQAALVNDDLRITERPERNEHSVVEYFCGPPSAPLDCAAVVAQLTSLSFYRAAPETSPTAVAQVNPADLEPGMVLGVSHAQTVDEVPFANCAGLLLVKSVRVEDNEITFFAPDAEMIPRGFLLVGGPSMRCGWEAVSARAI